MKVLIFQDLAQAEAYVASEVLARIEQAPNPVLGLATGGTMERVYARIVHSAQIVVLVLDLASLHLLLEVSGRRQEMGVMRVEEVHPQEERFFVIGLQPLQNRDRRFVSRSLAAAGGDRTILVDAGGPPVEK